MIASTLKSGSIGWFARHELLLFWRDWQGMISKEGRRRTLSIIIFGLIITAVLHGVAYLMLYRPLQGGLAIDKTTLITLSATLLLSCSMMMSQALESVTRAFYARSDMDLILASPTSSERVFTVRVFSIALSTAMLAVLLVAPFANVAAYVDGAKWLFAYPIFFSLGALATGLSVLITLWLFDTMGPKRTRLVAQIVASVVGAAFLIGMQIAAILSIGTFSRFELFSSPELGSFMPEISSLVWLPAYALLGDGASFLVFALFCMAILVLSARLGAPKFADRVQRAAGVPAYDLKQREGRDSFRQMNTAKALRLKEWALLKRDPWLVSQSLMQILYLIPPIVMLWQSFGENAPTHAILAPVLVMAVSQLAGGLAWLAISGEDASDLIQSAPIAPKAARLAKIQSVLGIVSCIAAPLLLALAFFNLIGALIVGAGTLIGALSAILIQMWFPVEMKRSSFRRRQTASRAATFTEAFSSVFWAGATCLAAAGSWFFLLFVALALMVLGAAYSISPKR